MKPLTRIVAIVAVCGICGTQALAQHSSTATQVVTFSVHRTSVPSPLASQSLAAQADQLGIDQSMSADHSPAFRLQPKLTITVDSPRRANTAIQLGRASSIVDVKKELLASAVRQTVVLTVSD